MPAKNQKKIAALLFLLDCVNAALGRDVRLVKIIQRNYNLAQSLKLNGTPSFLIGDTLLRGARDADTMLNLVRAARNKS